MNIQQDDSPVTHVMRCLRKHCDGEYLDRETLLSDLHLGSLDLIESLFELENIYGKTLSNAELAALLTIGDLAKAFYTSPTEQTEESDDCRKHR